MGLGPDPWKIPAGRRDSEPEWQLGYRHGEDNVKPEKPDDRLYVSGWLTGYMSLQELPGDAVAAFVWWFPEEASC